MMSLAFLRLRGKFEAGDLSGLADGELGRQGLAKIDFWKTGPHGGLPSQAPEPVPFATFPSSLPQAASPKVAAATNAATLRGHVL